MAITIKRPVRVRIVVTSEFRTRRIGELKTALAKLDIVRKQLAARIQAGEGKLESALVERFRSEQQRNEQTRAALKREFERVTGLEDGAEYDWGALEGTAQVEVGDDFSKLGACEIIVKDDKIIEIRDGQCLELSETSS